MMKPISLLRTAALVGGFFVAVVGSAQAQYFTGKVPAAGFFGNPTATKAKPQGYTIQSLTQLSPPSSTLDFLTIYDHVTGTLKKVNPSDLLSAVATGVTSFNTRAGVVTAQADDYKSFMGLNEATNCTLAASVASNALTIALKDNTGADPSASSPCVISFRNATLATGTYTPQVVTAANSITIASGSTAGFVNNTPGRLWVMACNDAGTVRLGVFNARGTNTVFPLEESTLFTGSQDQMTLTGNTHTSTTVDNLSSTTNLFVGMGVAGSGLTVGTTIATIVNSTSITLSIATTTTLTGTTLTFSDKVAGVLFTAGAPVTTKACRILGFATWESGLTTAGTWNATPTVLQLFGPGVRKPGDISQSVQANGGTTTGAITTNAFTDMPGLTATITLKSAANSIAYSWLCPVQVDTAPGALFGTLKRGGIAIGQLAGIFDNTSIHIGMAMGQGGDFPGAVGPFGYILSFQNTNNAGSAHAPANFGNVCNIVLNEVVN